MIWFFSMFTGLFIDIVKISRESTASMSHGVYVQRRSVTDTILLNRSTEHYIIVKFI